MSVRTISVPRALSRARVDRRETAVGHVIGLAFTLAAVGMLASAVVEKLDGGPEARSLLEAGLLVGVPGLVLWRRTKAPDRIAAPVVFAAVLSGWLAFTLVATLPYVLSGALERFDLALFEAVSGFTTTSSTVISPLDGLSHGVLFWRATTQWIGGISFVVLAVSVLPFLGVSMLELSAGPKMGPGERLGARVRTTAARLLPFYMGFTAVVVAAYGLLGMSVFDAVTHGFTTVSAGGFSTHDRSFAHFDSAALEWVAIAGMIVAGGSFALYWRALRGKPLAIFRSTEFRAYLAITFLFCLVAVAWNASAGRIDGVFLRRTIFTTVSLTSTTGYRMLDYDTWPDAAQLLLIFAIGLGGMAGSAAGGFKVERLLAVLSYSRRQLYGQLHPHAVAVIRFGRSIVPEVVLTRVVGFFGLFMAAGAVATFLVAAFGSDIRTSISAVAAALANGGSALGEVGPMRDYRELHAGSRGVLMLAMLVGRLEVYPVLLGAVPMLRFVADRLPRRLGRAVVRLGRG